MQGRKKSPPSTWRGRVVDAVCQIPHGRVCSYGDVAARLGHPQRARQVGTALASLGVDEARRVPWHRVVNAVGFISLRGGFISKDAQKAALQAEGVRVDAAFVVVDFAALRWREAPDAPDHGSP